MRRILLFLAALAVLHLHNPAFAQQEFVSRYDAFLGYAFLSSPHVSLFENGLGAQVGYRPKTWFSVGFDYSLLAGDGSLTAGLFRSNLQQQLAAQLAQLAAEGQIPPGYNLVLPFHSRTQTFAAGPQLAFRHFQHETIFVRPLFAGAIHETATPHPTDPIAGAIVAQLVPGRQKTDVVGFVGFGGGIDLLFSRHFAMRTQVDVVHDHLFSDLLKDGRWSIRFSVGPAFNFGKNIQK